MRKDKERLLRIGDVAELIEVPVHTLRYWERMFKEDLSPNRSSGGQRIYSELDVDKIREVKRLLKEAGYSIHGVRKIFMHLFLITLMLWKKIKRFFPFIGIALFTYLIIRLDLREILKQVVQINKLYLLGMW